MAKEKMTIEEISELVEEIEKNIDLFALEIIREGIE
ncbi:hypothetical protein LCGC14_0619630 [marine sediment metagenome]|uniref:Uncharacterized protein n=1 Tax=marine sediment metagenome TaxID=412755 RepID=A0A0F9TRS0_9ZZZZ